MISQRQTAKSIFLAAIEKHAPHEWPAFLDEACVGDEQLRPDVNKLLRSQQVLGSFHETPDSSLDATIAPLPSESPGTLIGPYKLLEQIGEGGMGLVYMAEQQQPVRRLVALKLVKPGMDTKQVIARFEAERQALAMMDHPNIAKVHDAGTTETGRPYFVMELVRGIPLNEFCDQKRLTVRERLQIFIQVCQAVQHAHQKGIIHRDLKPTNVLITMDDTVPFPKVIDFGIAKALGQSLTESTLHTGYAQLMGTPLYMSPEQAEMNLLGVDTRSDVYSLGVLLYELLTGTTPFDKETLTKASFDEMRRMIREDDPPRPSARMSTLRAEALSTISQQHNIDPCRISATLRGELDWIVMKALEKNRNRRYESASSLAADIQRYLTDEPVLACPPTTMYRFQKFARRHKPALATAAALALCLLLGTTVSAWQAVRATQAEAQASANEAEAQASEQEAKAQAQEATTQRDEAQHQRDEVKKLNDQLVATQEKLQQMLYASDMNQAKLAWDSSSTHRVYQLLQQHQPADGEPDRRDFEWHYLNRLYRSNLQHFNTGPGLVVDISLSPDGKRLAIASRHSRNVKVLDAETGQTLLDLPGHTQPIFSVSFSSDGKLLASSSGITGGGPPTLGAEKLGEVRIWNAETGKEILEIKETGGIEGVALSPDGTRVAGAGFNKTVRVWDVRSGNLLLTYKAHTANVLAVAYSPDGKRLASASGDKSVRIWDAESGAELLTLSGHEAAVIRVAYSPDGHRLASCSYDHTARIWDAETGKELFALRGQTAEVPGIAFSPDGKLLASAAMDRTVKIWDVDSGAENVTYRPAVNGCAAVTFSRDGKRMFCLGFGSVAICDAEFIQSQVIRSKYADQLVVFSPDGKRLVTTGDDTAAVWDVASREQVLTIKDTDIKPGIPSWGYMIDVSYSPDGRWLATTGRRGADPQDIDKDLGYSLKIWDAQRGALVHDLSSQIERARPVAFSHDGKRLAAAGFEGDQPVVHVWDVETAKIQLTFRGHKARVYGLAFSPDGRRIVSVSWTPRNETSKKVIVWNAATGGEFFALDFPRPFAPRSVAFSPDGQQLALGSFDRVSLISAETGAEIRNLSGHTNQFWQVQFHPNGKRLVTTALGGSVSLWDTQGGQEVLPLTIGQKDNPVACFSPDGNRLAIACRGVVRILDATPLPEKP